MKKTLLLIGMLLPPGALSGAYQYYYSDNLTSVNTTNWRQNGSLTPTSSGLTASGTGGSLISKISVPDGTSFYEVKATLNLANSGGNYLLLLRASNDALPTGSSSGTYYHIELMNPQFNGNSCTSWLYIAKRTGGVVTDLAFNAAFPCFHNTTIRAFISPGSGLGLAVNDVHYGWIADSSITVGQPGIAAAQMPAGNSITNVSLGGLDRIYPSSVDLQSVASSAFANEINFRWQPSIDDPNGTGVAYYTLFRNGSYLLAGGGREVTDAAVDPATTYTYTIFAADYHGNYSVPVYLSLTTPPATGMNPRRVGVRPTGTYWGSEGEQIDMWSGNLNFTLPLVNPKSRGGTGVKIGLSYNSQLWRKDQGGTWNLGRDIGYGFGWKLLAGSLMPYWSDPYTIHHYLFTDASGAEYRLSVNNGGIWTSQEGVYVTYDSNTKRLYFPNGSYWVMGCTSGGREQDTGTSYPTIIEDTNGNQITIQYYTGLGMASSNSSARIQKIQDVRSSLSYGVLTYSYTFNYSNDSIPHLTSIESGVFGGEQYSFEYLANQSLNSPFSPSVNFGTAALLQSVRITNFPATFGHQFQYDSSGSAELVEATLPYLGHIRWAHMQWVFTNNVYLREVQYRYLATATARTRRPIRSNAERVTGPHPCTRLRPLTTRVALNTFGRSTTRRAPGTLGSSPAYRNV